MQPELTQFLDKATDVLQRLKPLLPAVVQPIDWQQHLAARWVRTQQQGSLRPIHVQNRLTLADLLGVERQREQLVLNTRQFLQGLPCNHALMWGARGTGKSSLVRAILAEYADQGLRLVEVERQDLIDLPLIVESLRGRSERFIVFCDDLSFDEGETDFRQLKSTLDGSLEQAPDNVVLYATSNRRHLMPEYQSDNQSSQRSDTGELHPSEAIEDKIALSDRFGLWLSFYSFSQEHYLDVVCHWLERYAAQLAEQGRTLVWERDAEFEKAAIRWATARGNRNGRCAEQFARHWVGLLALQSE